MRVSYGVRTYIPAKLDEEVERRADSVVETIAEELVDRTKARIVDQDQVDTGQMLGSVEMLPKEKSCLRIVIVGAAHGIYQEFGTSKMPAKPFLGPEVDALQPELDAATGEIFK